MAHRVASDAEADLDHIWDYVAGNSSIETADQFVESLASKFLLLGAYPQLGRRRDDLRAGLRLFPVGDYLVLYRIDGEDVLVQRVVRASRDLEALLG